jgi:hypothetical protein
VVQEARGVEVAAVPADVAQAASARVAPVPVRDLKETPSDLDVLKKNNPKPDVPTTTAHLAKAVPVKVDRARAVRVKVRDPHAIVDRTNLAPVVLVAPAGSVVPVAVAAAGAWNSIPSSA